MILRRCILIFIATLFTWKTFAADEVYVIETVRPLSAQELSALKNRFELKSFERLSPYQASEYFNRVYRAEGRTGQAALLESEKLVRKVDLAQTLLPLSTEAAAPDPLLGEQWHLVNKGQSVHDEITDIRSQERKGTSGTDIGWLKARTSLEKMLKRDVSVAIIDSGLDYEHEEIVNQLYKNESECKNGKPPVGTPKEDTDNNGYKGDCIGINLIPKRPENANKPTDDVGHGTHVAGIIAATPDNGIGIAGLSSRIKVLPIKVYASEEIKDSKPLTDRVAEAILYAVARKVDVINMSLGWPITANTEYLHKAILEAQSKGILIVAAAGNNSHSGPIYPCAYKKVICVGSVTIDGTLSNFSNYGPHVDIVAPGSFILSLFPKTMIPQYFSAKGYEIKSGTSQAAPLVAGTVALLKGAFTNESAEQTRGRLLAATRQLSGLRTGGGLLRLDDSLLGHFQRKNAIEFKETELVTIKDKSITVNFPIETFVAGAAKPQVSLKSAGPQVNSPNLKVLNGMVQISGAVTNLKLHHEWPLTLSLNGHDYEISLPLIRAHSPAQILRRLPEGLEPLQLRTVYPLDVNTQAPQSFRVSKTETGIDLQMYEVQGDSVNQLFQKHLAGETAFLGAASIDLDNDSVRDFLVFTYHVEKNPTEGDVLRLSLHYLNSKGEGLYGGNGQLTLLDANNSFNFVGLLNFPKVSFTRYNLKDGRTILMPSLIERGLRPTIDQSKEDRRATPRLINHIYYLEPGYDAENRLGFRMRVVDSAAFEADVRKNLKLYFYEQLQPLMPIVQTPQMRAMGRSQYLLVAGQEEMAKDLMVTLDADGKISWQPVDTGMRVHGYSSTPIWKVGAQSEPRSGTAAFGLITTTSFDGGFWDEQKTGFTHRFQVVNPDPTEDIARILQIFEMDNAKYVIYESTSLLNVLRIDQNGRTNLFSTLVRRVSFLAQLFTQVVSSIAISEESRFKPGLYVDNTQINARSAHTWDITGDHPIAPISLTLHVPAECKALNPVQLEGRFHYVMACKNNPNLTFVPVSP